MAVVLQIARSFAKSRSWVLAVVFSASVGRNCVSVRKQQQAGQILQVLVPAGKHRMAALSLNSPIRHLTSHGRF